MLCPSCEDLSTCLIASEPPFCSLRPQLHSWASWSHRILGSHSPQKGSCPAKNSLKMSWGLRKWNINLGAPSSALDPPGPAERERQRQEMANATPWLPALARVLKRNENRKQTGHPAWSCQGWDPVSPHCRALGPRGKALSAMLIWNVAVETWPLLPRPMGPLWIFAGGQKQTFCALSSC